VDSSDDPEPAPPPEETDSGETDPDDPQSEDVDSDELLPVESEDPDCEETRRSLCVPIGLDYVGDYDGEDREAINDSSESELAGGDDESESESEGEGDQNDTPSTEEPSDMTDNDDVEESSCRSTSRGASPWMLFGLLVLLGLRRRTVLD
jgi:MYXO-CTERM domain-containing protein